MRSIPDCGRSIHRALHLNRIAPVFLLLLFFLPGPASASPVVIHAEIVGAIHGVTSEYVARAIEKGEESGAALVVFTIDTPGGLVTSTEAIIQEILSSRVPVAFLVAPSGASATSAGFYITISSDIAAMAPGTRIGAAHPVTPFGDNEKENIMMQKAENDLAAQARSIAQNRNRNVEVAERMVRDSISLTESEALEENLIDLLSKSVPDLLANLDGRSIRRFDGTEVVLDLQGAVVETFEMTTRQKILAVVSDPTVSFVLFIVGVLGLYMEFTNPGLIVPGIVGGIALLLFAISAQILPLNLFGLLLIGLGIALLILEIKVTSYGMLTVGGIVAITLGFLTLFEGPIPELRLPLVAILPVSITVGLIMAFLTQRAVRAQLWKVATGTRGLVGEVGTALTEVGAGGKVFVHGEYWDATAREAIPSGERVRICAVKDMVIEVERAAKS
jgi:membrane-bound serine protease (ClpP class)